MSKTIKLGSSNVTITGDGKMYRHKIVEELEKQWGEKDLMDTARDEIVKKVVTTYNNEVFEAFKQHGYSKEEILDPKNRERFHKFRWQLSPYDYVEDWSADGILLFRIAPISTMDIGKSFKVTTEYHVFHFREPGFTPLRKE